MANQSESVSWLMCYLSIGFSIIGLARLISCGFQLTTGHWLVFSSTAALRMSMASPQSRGWDLLLWALPSTPGVWLAWGRGWACAEGAACWPDTSLREACITLSLRLRPLRFCLVCLLRAREKGGVFFLSSLNPSPSLHFPSARFTPVAKISLPSYVA